MPPIGPRAKNVALLFHNIPSKEWFEGVISTIERVYDFVTIDEVRDYFYEGKKYKNRCIVTFDDGHRSVYENAYPVLKEKGIPATIFVSPKVTQGQSNYWFQELYHIRNHVDDMAIKKVIAEHKGCDIGDIQNYMLYPIFLCMRYNDIHSILEKLKKENGIEIERSFNLNEDHLKELKVSRLITFGAHSMNHPVLKNEDEEDVRSEVRESINGLSEIIGSDIRYFAYPNGTGGLDQDEREKKILKENSIELSFTTDPGNYYTGTDPLNIPRVGYTMTKRQSSFWILEKLYFSRMWENVRFVLKRGRTINAERIKIKKLKQFNSS
jgi:peptidoglycan/xylan/chitin deacetylase (PgdA/CDA1 family)